MTKPVTKDEVKLCKAVDVFAEKMKERLIAKARKGYFGWNLKRDLNYLKKRIYDKASKFVLSGLPYDKDELVDIANFSMMVDRMENKHGQKRT